MGTKLFRRRPTLADTLEDRSLKRSAQFWPQYATVTLGDLSPDDALRISDVFGCIRLLADTCASLPLIAYRRVGDGDRERYAGRFADLIERPSPGNVTANLIGTAVAHLACYGNAFIGKYRGADGTVEQLAPLLPRGMLVELDAGIPKYTYSDQNGVQTLGTADVLHLKALSVDGVSGMSPIAQASAGLSLAQNLGQHANSFAVNGGRPGGVLRVPGWRSAQPDASENLRSDWENAFTGTDKSGKLLIVTGDESVEYIQLGLSLADAEFVAQRELSSREICRIFRVPPHLLGVTVASSRTYANAEQESLDFVKFSLAPYLTLIETAISADSDLSPGTAFCEFLLDSLLRADSLTRATVYEKGIASGWLTVDECRERENLPKLPAASPAPAELKPATMAGPAGVSPPLPNDPEAAAAAPTNGGSH